MALFISLSKALPRGITHCNKEFKFIFSATSMREVYPADPVMEQKSTVYGVRGIGFCLLLLHLLSLVPPIASSFSTTNNYICVTALLWNFFKFMYAKYYKLFIIITFKTFNFSVIDFNVDFVRQKEEKRKRSRIEKICI